MDVLKSNPWRNDFPALAQTMNGKRLAFLDSAASAQKPRVVLDAHRTAYELSYANVHRGLYEFSQEKTAQFEAVRGKVAAFMGASSPQNIVFTKNTTEAINLVAQSWARTYLTAGDEIILSVMEHHANLVPWHILKTQTGITIKYIPVTDDGALDYVAFEKLISPKTKLVAVTHVSNVLGTHNDIDRIRRTLNVSAPQAKLLVDGSQAIVHGGVNVAKLDADFYVWTAHKLYGPTGVGVLYGKADILDSMPPFLGGGDMIDTVTLEGSTFAPPPARFEAGTPAIAEVIALGAAIDYVTSIGVDKILAWEDGLLAYTNSQLAQIKGLRIIGTQPNKAPVISFMLGDCAPADVAMILDKMGVAVRTGHHCCQPLMQQFGVTGTVRASLALYSDKDDIDQLCMALDKAQNMLG